MAEMNDESKCQLCGEPMPAGEEMFKYHGYSGPCPKNASAPVRESIDHKLLLERMDGALRNAVGMLEAYQKLVPDARAQLEIKLAKEIIDSAELKAALAPPVASAPVGEPRNGHVFDADGIWCKLSRKQFERYIMEVVPAREVGEGLREAQAWMASITLIEQQLRVYVEELRAIFEQPGRQEVRMWRVLTGLEELVRRAAESTPKPAPPAGRAK